MFLDERITEKLLYGSGADQYYSTYKHEVYGGRDYRKSRHPYELFRSNMLVLDMDDDLQAAVVMFHKRTLGGVKSFRVKNPYYFSTNNGTEVPTYNDGKCEAGVSSWHITDWYDDDSISTAPRRRVLKPNTGTVVAGIRDDLGNPHEVIAVSTDPDPDVTRWTVDESTGVITFTANSQNIITGISQASSAVLTLGASHGRVVDDSIHISAVAGMVEINGLRGTITAVTATTVTVNIDSSLFTTYTSGGETNTAPQTNETVTAGCYYDIPCVFEDDNLHVDYANYKILSASVGVIETYNP